jgi:hypothetical protein
MGGISQLGKDHGMTSTQVDQAIILDAVVIYGLFMDV